jgi:hypothetical protein
MGYQQIRAVTCSSVDKYEAYINTLHIIHVFQVAFHNGRACVVHSMYCRCRALLARRKCAGPWVTFGQYCTWYFKKDKRRNVLSKQPNDLSAFIMIAVPVSILFAESVTYVDCTRQFQDFVTRNLVSDRRYEVLQVFREHF